MKELKKMDFDVYDWLAEKPPTQWSKSHFQTFIKSDMLLNNLCESFNSMILDARDKSIISMFERIRCRLMRRIHVNREKMMSLSDSLLCPKIEKILEKIKGDAAYCLPEWSGTPKFEVNGPGGRFVRDLDAGTCACRRWDLTGIPCKHAVAAIYYFGTEPEEFVNKCYHKQTYIDCYSNHLLPLNGQHLWLNMGMEHISPPSYCVVKGKATKGARRFEEGEKQNKKGADPYKLGNKHQQSLKCVNCGSVGHNKKKCKEPLKRTATVKKPRGRPRKPTVEGETSNTQANTKRKRQPKKNTKPPVKRTFQAQVTFEPVQQDTQINN